MNDANEAPAVIRGLTDVQLVPTPVEISEWTEAARARRTVLETMARLHPAARGRLVTAWSTTIRLGAWSCTGRYEGCEILPRPPGGDSAWRIRLAWIPPRHRRAEVVERDFPTAPIIAAWGAWDIALGDWQSTRQRVVETVGPALWLDTTAE